MQIIDIETPDKTFELTIRFNRENCVSDIVQNNVPLIAKERYVDMDSSYVIGGFTTEYWNDSCWFKIDSSYTVITIYNPNITVIWDTFKARSF